MNAPPSVTGLRVRRRIHARGTPPQMTRRRRGATIRFRLSEAATVKLSFARRLAGGRYRKVRRAVSLQGTTGLNRVSFHGRLSKRRSLKPGAYRLTIVASDGEGVRSTPKRARFRLLRG